MTQDTLEIYAELFQWIRDNSKTKLHGIQLECISKLVFFGGVQRQQIPELKVRNVFDGKGRPLEKTTNIKKEIILNDEMKRALEDYFKELKSRRSSKAKRKSVLFPDYRTERKLRLHWEKFGTNYSQIKRDGKLYEEEEEQRRREERWSAINYYGSLEDVDYEASH